MSLMRQELERRRVEAERKKAIQSPETSTEQDTFLSDTQRKVCEEHLMAALGWQEWVESLPRADDVEFRAKVIRLARQFETAAKRGQSVDWLKHETGDPPKSKGEQLRVALVLSGYETLRREDDPLLGEDLAEAAKKVFEGMIR